MTSKISKFFLIYLVSKVMSKVTRKVSKVPSNVRKAINKDNKLMSIMSIAMSKVSKII